LLIKKWFFSQGGFILYIYIYFWVIHLSNDSKFFTNEPGSTLADRLSELAKYSEYFDALVGYFYSSGFHEIYPSLEGTSKIRILIGISTNNETLELINKGSKLPDDEIYSSHQIEKKIKFEVEAEISNSEDTISVEEGVHKFIEWIKSGKLIIKAYPSQNIHAKLYIMTFKDGDREKGTVITGSSNLSRSGLKDNLEFNVELKDRPDFDFAISKFNELWSKSIDVSEAYVETIEDKTWLSDKITPYHLYLKFLYEYFKKDLNHADEINLYNTPDGFMELDYQTQAVINAKKILSEYGGVFISDVVGLGKTFICAMLANQLNGKHLVIAPPVLLDEENPGSWRNAFEDFGVRQSAFVSIGKLDTLLEGKSDKYENVFIDEAHRMRNADTATYEKLAEICRGKRVILVSATPYNNSPMDILSLVKLFQKPRNSTLPLLKNLDSFFKGLDNNIKKEDRRKDYLSFLKVTEENAKAVRDRVLKYLMVRRTRSDIVNFFSDDLDNQGLKFPEVVEPQPLYYKLSDKENEIFDKTINMLANEITYARYMPMTYYTGDDLNQSELIGQRNLGRFMKILLIKRLESSFFAFKNSIERFLNTYETFINAFEDGDVYISKKHSNKILDFLENDNEEAINKLLHDDKAQKYKKEDFTENFLKDLKNDKKVLQKIKDLWSEVDRDPKLEEFIKELSRNNILKDSHLIVFTESKETARYLFSNLQKIYAGKVICYDGNSSAADKKRVIQNFDAKVFKPENKFRILIATEVLAEGVNLHRSNVVINYDIPWNPTRLMQRIGRINRIDTKFKKIYTYNFFPSVQGDKEIALENAAKSKIAGFLALLGGDASLLTDGEEIASHSLFDRLNSIENEETEDSELKYLKFIKDIRKNDPDLFDQIKRLPKKARSAKKSLVHSNYFLTYFRRGKNIQKFFIANKSDDAKEIYFIDAVKLLESLPETKREKILPEMFNLLEKNKLEFEEMLLKEKLEKSNSGGNDSSAKLLKILRVIKKQSKQFTDNQDTYLDRVIKQLTDRGLPTKTIKSILGILNNLGEEANNELKVISALETTIPDALLNNHYAEKNITSTGKSEVVLSMYLH